MLGWVGSVWARGVLVPHVHWPVGLTGVCVGSERSDRAGCRVLGLLCSPQTHWRWGVKCRCRLGIAATDTAWIASSLQRVGGSPSIHFPELSFPKGNTVKHRGRCFEAF